MSLAALFCPHASIAASARISHRVASEPVRRFSVGSKGTLPGLLRGRITPPLGRLHSQIIDPGSTTDSAVAVAKAAIVNAATEATMRSFAGIDKAGPDVVVKGSLLADTR